jgi:hypothetical protein
MGARRTLAAAALTAGLLVAGAGVAAADPTPTPTPTPAPITLSPEQSAWVCNERIPRLLERIATLQARIAGDPDTPGSTARLEQRLADARAAGRTAQVQRLEERLVNRPRLSDRLAEAQRRIEAFRDEKCA